MVHSCGDGEKSAYSILVGQDFALRTTWHWQATTNIPASDQAGNQTQDLRGAMCLIYYVKKLNTNYCFQCAELFSPQSSRPITNIFMVNNICFVLDVSLGNNNVSHNFLAVTQQNV